MVDIAGSVIAFIVAISILVAVHEYGHYIVGKWTGMKVLRYSIGFGKPLFMRRGKDRDATEYCVSAIPLGGYVRFLDSREGFVDPEDDGRAFDQRPIAARVAVLLAGPAFNFLLAILLYWVLFVHGENIAKPAIGEITPQSYAAQADLREGDRILSVGDSETSGWESALLAILDEMVADGRVPLQVVGIDGAKRDVTIVVGDDKTRLTEPGVLFEGLGFLPWRPSSTLGEIAADGSARAAGLQPGDRITSVDGDPIVYFGDLVQAVAARPNQSVTINFLRDGREQQRTVRLGTRELNGETIGRLGAGPEDDPSDYYYFRQFGAVAAIGEAIGRTWDSSVFTVKMLGRMVTGDVSIKNISGPINIAQFAGETAQRGITYFIGFLAIVSISLGVLNLLPVPVLDGGQIVYQLVEGLKGSPMSERSQILGQQVGIFALLLLMSFAFYNDIVRLVS